MNFLLQYTKKLPSDQSTSRLVSLKIYISSLIPWVFFFSSLWSIMAVRNTSSSRVVVLAGSVAHRAATEPLDPEGQGVLHPLRDWVTHDRHCHWWQCHGLWRLARCCRWSWDHPIAGSRGRSWARRLQAARAERKLPSCDGRTEGDQEEMAGAQGLIVKWSEARAWSRFVHWPSSRMMSSWNWKVGWDVSRTCSWRSWKPVSEPLVMVVLVMLMLSVSNEPLKFPWTRIKRWH